jgi:glycine cleavage system H lipoate-binding protein
MATEKLFMIPDHAWAQLEPDRTVRIGMAHAFASGVGEVADIELPAEDQLLEQGRMCVVVRAEDGVEHYLQSPFSGRVLEVNRMASEEPELAVRDPEKSGWLLRLEPQAVEKELPNLVEKG